MLAGIQFNTLKKKDDGEAEKHRLTKAKEYIEKFLESLKKLNESGEDPPAERWFTDA